MFAKHWLQVNEDGFGYQPSTSMSAAPRLFAFGGDLYAYNEHGLFRMDKLVFRKWDNVYVPGGGLRPLGAHLYCSGDALRFINQGEIFSNANWHQVASQDLPPGAVPLPMTVFGGQMYAITRHVDAATNKNAFHVWRSPDIGKPAMNWEQVVANSFGDPQNNHDVDFMGEFNGKLYAGTQTLEGNFGSTQRARGVEIWESPSGNPGSWAQVNADGFGTEIAQLPGQQLMRTNHMIGSWVVYKGPAQSQSGLYVGTKSHWGAEVWRYDGTGLGGWQNVTPPWAGAPGPGRNEAMALFDDCLYLAEGYPTANLAKYDGANWSVEVSGPNPFDPQDGGLSSAVVNDKHLYVHTIHAFGIGATKGDQVWGYPYYFPVLIELKQLRDLHDIVRRLPDVGDPPGIELREWIRNVLSEAPRTEPPTVDELSDLIVRVDTLDEAELRETLARVRSQMARLATAEKLVLGRLKG